MELVQNVNNDLPLSTTLLIHLKVAHSVSIEGAMLLSTTLLIHLKVAHSVSIEGAMLCLSLIV
jgi:hypothetical protein